MPSELGHPQARPPAAAPVAQEDGGMVAILATIAVVLVTTVLGEREVLTGVRLVGFVLVMLAFAAVTIWSAQVEGRPGLVGVLLVAQGVIVLALLWISDYFGSVPLLAMISISLAQLNLPRRLANLYAVAVLGAVLALYGVVYNWTTALEIGAGYGAGAVFVVVFTRVAMGEARAREQVEALYRDLERANAQLAEYAAQAEQLATVRERNRLAREVHDSLGHYLTVINVQLELATKLLNSDATGSREALLRAKALASEGLAEVRRSVAALRPSPLDDRPLPQVLRDLTDDARNAGLIVSFEQTGMVRSLSPETETVLYRATQESLTNVHRHAHATSAEVRLAFESDVVRLCVRDNGVGRQGKQDGMGLVGLQERVGALGGSLRAENHPDGGFVIEVALPYGDGAHG